MTPKLHNAFALSLLLLASVATSAHAWGTKQANLGGLDGFVERMGAGIAELGRGNTGVSDEESEPAAYWNPACVASTRKIGISLGGEDRSLGRAGGYVGAQGGVGARAGVGVAFLDRAVLGFPVVNEEDVDLGTVTPHFWMAWIGLGWRVSRQDMLGLGISRSGETIGVASKYSDIEMNDASQGPTSLDLGWHRSWNPRFESGLVIRNIGFNRDLSARWTRNPSRDNTLPSSQAFRPKTLEAGVTYHTKLLAQPFDLHLEALDYQLADTLLVFDPDWHYWTARMGLEWQAIDDAWLRAGYDSGNLTFGAGYHFKLSWNGKPWPLQVDWALVREGTVGFWNPLSLGLRTQLP